MKEVKSKTKELQEVMKEGQEWAQKCANNEAIVRTLHNQAQKKEKAYKNLENICQQRDVCSLLPYILYRLNLVF